MKRFFSDFTKYSRILNAFSIEQYLPRTVSHANLHLTEDYDIDSLTKGLSDPIWDMLDRGGKQWRALLCLITADLLECPAQDMVPFAKIIELIHAGSLICDDIEDRSEKRRGKPSTYKIFGIDRALNAGNFMYFLALQMILKVNISEEIQQRIISDYAQEMINIHYGQCTDIEWNNSDFIPNEAQYLRMVSNKTSVLSRLSVKIAIRLSAKDSLINDILVSHAENIGISFQIWDDIINLESEEYAKGRSYLGEDITEGKKTLIIIQALKKNPQKSSRLREILALKTKDLELVNEALQIIKETDAIHYCKQFALKTLEKSWHALDQQLPETPAKQDFYNLTFKLIDRKF